MISRIASATCRVSGEATDMVSEANHFSIRPGASRWQIRANAKRCPRRVDMAIAFCIRYAESGLDDAGYVTL